MSISSQKGFSLLEVMIAFALIVVVVAGMVITQGASATSSVRNRNVIIATSLARNLINEQEVKYEGVALDRLPKTETKNFPEPNKDFKWTIAYDEVDFGPLTALLTRASQKQNEGSGGDTAGQSDMLLKIFKDYLQKSVRRMTVTIEWPEGKGVTTQTFTELLVNYDADFNLAL